MGLRGLPVLVAITAALGCVGPPAQTFPGPERPREEVALLRETSNTTVVAIDGVRVSGRSWILLPGRHELVLESKIFTSAPNTQWAIWSWCRVPFDALAGESYRALARHEKEVASGLGERVTMRIGVADEAGTMRALAISCSGERPEI